MHLFAVRMVIYSAPEGHLIFNCTVHERVLTKIQDIHATVQSIKGTFKSTICDIININT